MLVRRNSKSGLTSIPIIAKRLYSDNLTREEVMNSQFVPALEDIASRRVALFLYNDPEISRLSECKPFEEPTTEWNDLVNEKVSKLFLPAPIQRRLLVTASSDCLWIARYNALHHKYSSICGDQCQCLERILLNCYLQPSDGLFNMLKFFDDLTRDQRIDLKFRFILACEFSITQKMVANIPLSVLRIHELWKQIDQNGRKDIMQDSPYEMKAYIELVLSLHEKIFEFFRDECCSDYVPVAM
ncbi:hypothetical protein AVEN_136902-1 [Araneus ventricosus]|uniref:Uncharacterized protein n=1 Tax=Araneus ventricosus TaxID=182803 RepID=A0A4Y2BHF1_ARAVE|nr:hypothetical protein AVEN_136902-1 [Araneus ventricosus]